MENSGSYLRFSDDAPTINILHIAEFSEDASSIEEVNEYAEESKKLTVRLEKLKNGKDSFKCREEIAKFAIRMLHFLL